MCDIFAEIPVVLACIIVGEWLKLKDLAALDAAYVGSNKQKHLKEHILSSPECILSAVPDAIQAPRFFRWIGKNSVRVRKLVLNEAVVNCEDHLLKFGHYVRCAFVHNFKSMNVVAHYCQNITRIGLHLTSNAVDLRTVLVALLALPVLSHLNFHCESHLSFSGIALVHHQMRLKSIRTLCTGAANHDLLALCAPSAVQRLDVSCSVEWLIITIRALSAHEEFNNLHALALRKSISNTEEGLFNLLALCPHVMHLCCENCNNDSFASELSAFAISHNLPHLVSLNVCNSAFSDKLLVALAENCCDTLQALFTTKCGKMTHAGYNELLQHCHKLHTLSVTLTDKLHTGFDKPQLSKLRTLIIDDSQGVDDVMYTIAQYCKHLKNLKFTFSGYVYAMHSFTQLRSEYMPALRTLVVCSSTALCVYSSALEALRRERPALHITHDPQALAYDFMSLRV